MSRPESRSKSIPTYHLEAISDTIKRGGRVPGRQNVQASYIPSQMHPGPPAMSYTTIRLFQNVRGVKGHYQCSKIHLKAMYPTSALEVYSFFTYIVINPTKL